MAARSIRDEEVRPSLSLAVTTTSSSQRSPRLSLRTGDFFPVVTVTESVRADVRLSESDGSDARQVNTADVNMADVRKNRVISSAKLIYPSPSGNTLNRALGCQFLPLRRYFGEAIFRLILQPDSQAFNPCKPNIKTPKIL